MKKFFIGALKQLSILFTDFMAQIVLGALLGLVMMILGVKEGTMLEDFMYQIATIMTCVLVVIFVSEAYHVQFSKAFSITRLDKSIVLSCVSLGLCLSAFMDMILSVIFYIILKLPQQFQEYNINTGIFYFIAIVLVAPITEEMVFRIGMIESSKKDLGLKNSIIISSLIFGILHFTDISVVLNCFITGLFLAFVYVKTGNIVYSIILHMTNNLYAVLVGFLPENISKLFYMEINGVILMSIPIYLISIVGTIIPIMYLKKRFSKQTKSL